MKKMMMIAAALAVAGMARAASVEWGGNVGFTDGSYTTAGTAYLLYSATEIAAGGTGSSSYGDFNPASGLVSYPGASIVATSAITEEEANANGTFTRAFTRADADGGCNGYWAVVYVDASTPTKYGLFTAQTTGLSDSTGAGEVLLNTGFGVGEALIADQFTSVVPEPCAMALLLLGVAALGLKRKLA